MIKLAYKNTQLDDYELLIRVNQKRQLMNLAAARHDPTLMTSLHTTTLNDEDWEDRYIERESARIRRATHLKHTLTEEWISATNTKEYAKRLSNINDVTNPLIHNNLLRQYELLRINEQIFQNWKRRSRPITEEDLNQLPQPQPLSQQQLN